MYEVIIKLRVRQSITHTWNAELRKIAVWNFLGDHAQDTLESTDILQPKIYELVEEQLDVFIKRSFIIAILNAFLQFEEQKQWWVVSELQCMDMIRNHFSGAFLR